MLVLLAVITSCSTIVLTICVVNLLKDNNVLNTRLEEMKSSRNNEDIYSAYYTYYKNEQEKTKVLEDKLQNTIILFEKQEKEFSKFKEEAELEIAKKIVKNLNKE